VARDNQLCLTTLITQQEEGENDAADEQPLADVERNDDTTAGLVGTFVEDLVGPARRSQHGDGGEDVGHVDGEGLEEDEEEEDVLGAHLEAIVSEIGDGDEIEFMVLDDLALPFGTTTHGEERTGEPGLE